eukprot:TRINITY_DN774_c0_g1_i1.p3 TRINITY_DN774_c0_g1~~TRINITY_DN774_c0_g1_i1.p3  ORF type:complete len:99 (-),score=14.79 TRINITY_DN774_c0_g1_i1:280-576(-)
MISADTSATSTSPEVIREEKLPIKPPANNITGDDNEPVAASAEKVNLEEFPEFGSRKTSQKSVPVGAWGAGAPSFKHKKARASRRMNGKSRRRPNKLS